MSQHTWARRIRREREARNWTQADAVRRLRFETTDELPADDSLIRSWKRWESGESKPDGFYQPLLASLFGTVTAALFAEPRSAEVLLAGTEDVSTLEVLTRMRTSSVDTATLDALRITVDRLCIDYPSVPSAQLLIEGRNWLHRIGGLLDQRMTLTQHREVLSLAGLLALLVGCLEYDSGNRRAAEATRRSALALGSEADDRRVQAWAYEMTCWFSLTSGDYRGVLAAAEAGAAIGGNRDVSVQLAAQEAKAWARVGDQRRVTLALDRGRRLMEHLPHPEDVRHHFAIDASKWDFYGMDCYRVVGDDQLASAYADQVIEAGTDITGRALAPMRIAEARVTQGVVAARQGDLDGAVTHGRAALAGDRQSLPSLLMVSSELGREIRTRYADEPEAQDYLDELASIGNP